MKQKNNQVKAKANANGVQKSKIGKKQKNVAEVVQVKAPVAKNNKNLKGVVAKNSKNQKTPKKALPPKKVVVEEEDDDDDDDDVEDEEVDEENSENEEDSGADVEADADEPASELEEESSNEQLADDDEEDDDDDDEQESDNDEEEVAEEEDDDANSENDGPVEKPIGKKTKTNKQIGIPKIKCSDLPMNFPNDQVIVVKNLPKKKQFKQIDLVEVFAKYGTLDTIKPVYRLDASSFAYIAYTTPEAAKAALAADKTNIRGSVVDVVPRPINKNIKLMEEKKKHLEEEIEKRKQFIENSDRCIFVKNLKKGTKEETLREYFASCGEIENISIRSRGIFHYAFITFTEKASAQAAVKLNNTICNNATIGVFISGDQRSRNDSKDPKRTVIMKNVQQVESFPGTKVEEIFASCGEIENIDIVCKKVVLAFITFKDEDSLTKALALSGTTYDDVKLEITQYEKIERPQNTSVFMINVRPDISESAIRSFFAETGEISEIFLKPGFAIVKFADKDGYCKAFLLNENKLAGKQVFLEPYSENKKRVLRDRKDLKGKKRSFPFVKSTGGKYFKKPKIDKD